MSTESYGPVVQRALLTNQLVQFRHNRGETQEAVAKSLEWSVSKLIRIEGGSVGISKSDLEALLRHYGIKDISFIEKLAEQAREARNPGWWDKHHIPDKAFLAYIGYEAGASYIRMVQGLLVPGLLQIEPYSRRIVETYTSRERVDSIVDLRNARKQKVLARGAKQLHILDEAVIRRRVDDVMPQQLEHLVELAGRPEITIRIVPFREGPHFGMKGSFTLLSFDNGLDDILYREGGRRGDLVVASRGSVVVGGHISEEVRSHGGEIAEYVDGFDSLSSLALSPSESVEFIKEAIRTTSLPVARLASDSRVGRVGCWMSPLFTEFIPDAYRRNWDGRLTLEASRKAPATGFDHAHTHSYELERLVMSIAY